MLNLQASKTYPQLAEHAARLKCQPSSEFGQFMHEVMSRETAPNYDNVIATSAFLTEDDTEKEAKVTLHLPSTACSDDVASEAQRIPGLA